jgi:hypothetical protein
LEKIRPNHLGDIPLKKMRPTKKNIARNFAQSGYID